MADELNRRHGERRKGWRYCGVCRTVLWLLVLGLLVINFISTHPHLFR